MPSPTRFREVFPGGEKAAGHARRVLARWLGDSVAAHDLGDVQLLVTEVVANSVRHGGVGEDGEIDLQVGLEPEVVRVEVRDTGIQGDPRVRQPDLMGGGGFGMVLVERMSRAWGVEHEPRMVMWFELALDTDGGPATAGRATGRGRRPQPRRTRTPHRARGGCHGGLEARVRLRLAAAPSSHPLCAAESS
jgi:anti-sigma regulatory factor (Ser/Thr protein kinase)